MFLYILFAFLAHLIFFFKFFSIFYRFWEDCWRNLQDFEKFFRRFVALSLKMPIWKNVAFSQGKTTIFHMSSIQKLTKKTENRKQINAIWEWEPKKPQNALKSGFGRVLTPFGWGLGRSGAFFGNSWASKWEPSRLFWCPRAFPKASKIQSFAQDASQEASKSTPSSILELPGLDFQASRLDFRASGTRFQYYFGTTGRKISPPKMQV